MSRLIGLLSILCACSLAPAVTLQKLTLDEMAQSATAVVRARVTGSFASLNGSTIYTHYKLQVSETWKGIPATEVVVPGGVAGGYRQSFPGMPTLQPGTDYVLFLWTSPAGVTNLVGLSQGIFNVTQLRGGDVEVSRAEIGETMLDTAGHRVKDHAMRMRFSDMKTHVMRTMSARATAK